jgi:hypothetical protein
MPPNELIEHWHRKRDHSVTGRVAEAPLDERVSVWSDLGRAFTHRCRDFAGIVWPDTERGHSHQVSPFCVGSTPDTSLKESGIEFIDRNRYGGFDIRDDNVVRPDSHVP